MREFNPRKIHDAIIRQKEKAKISSDPQDNEDIDTMNDAILYLERIVKGVPTEDLYE